jgi:cyclophilin family peptidyl-prolyl cis-trans isomerase
MNSRITLSLFFVSALAVSASAQVVRFETTMGNFDMVLNPTHNARLQGHVDNMLKYVEDDRYLGSLINRAARDTELHEDFVLQMGGFFSHTKRPPLTQDSISRVFTDRPIAGEPAAENPGLSNTVGMVAMALPQNSSGATNQDGGTSEFFVNLKNNNFLDPDFTVFAAISDMSVINAIMRLQTIDRTKDPLFGSGGVAGSLTDVPIMSDGKQVFIKRAFVLTDTLSTAKANAAVKSMVEASAAAASASALASQAVAPIATAAGAPGGVVPSVTVPEPGTLGLLAVASLAASMLVRRRR